jgi:Methyltransferase domain
VTASATSGLQEALHTWDTGAWCLAALVSAVRADGSSELTAAAAEVMAAAGLRTDVTLDPAAVTPGQLASQAAAPLLQTSALVSGRPADWGAHSDEALRAQGEASAQGASAFARFALPQMGDLPARLAAPGARMLDVGTGVAALAVAYAEAFPRLQVLGLDVLDRALDLARQTIAASPAGRRVSVRKQDVAEFADGDGFDLAWLPAPFIPAAALRAGLPRVVAALRPGGWLLVGHGKFSGHCLDDALNRFKTVAFGGTPLDDAEAQRALTEQGLAEVRTLPTPPGAPAITVGRR